MKLDLIWNLDINKEPQKKTNINKELEKRLVINFWFDWGQIDDVIININ